MKGKVTHPSNLSLRKAALSEPDVGLASGKTDEAKQATHGNIYRGNESTIGI